MDKDEHLTTKLWVERHEGRSSGPTNRYTSYSFKLNKTTIDSLSVFIKKNHLDWNTVIHAAWGLLLNHFSSADVITFGSGTLNGAHGGSLKANAIRPVKSVMDEKNSLKTYINHIQKQLTKEANYDKHKSDLHYLLLVKNSKAKNSQHSLIKSTAINPKQFSLILVPGKDTKESLHFYYTSTLTKKALINLTKHLEILLQEFEKNLHHKVVHLNILLADEKEKVLHEWNMRKKDGRVPQLTLCCHELFINMALKFPNNLAINHNEHNVSYKVLQEESNQMAHHLLMMNVKLGDRVCVLMDRTPALIIVMMAIFKCGAIFVPINSKYPDERIEYVLNDSDPKCILVNETHQLPERFRHIAMFVDKELTLVKHHSKAIPLTLPFVDGNQVAYIIYTSGTTGNPKGVMVRHKSLTNFIAWYMGCFGINENDRASQFASPAFDSYLCEVIPFLACGASVHIVDDNIKLTPSLFFDWLVNHEITVLDLSTSYAMLLFAQQWPKNIKLKTVKIGGESVTHYPSQSFPFDIWNAYGPTETTIEVIFKKIYAANTTKLEKQNATPPIGKPLPNAEVYVVDKYMEPVPIGVAGELLIGGPVVSIGYLNREDLTDKKFIPDIFDKKSPDKLYRTGDLVRWLPDGNLEYIGRIDHQVKIRGFRIELGDIENAISKHPDVNEVVVIAKENLNGEKSLIAYIVPNLDKERYLYQERCLVSVDNYYIEALTEDISKNGVALTGITDELPMGQQIKLHLKLPGFNESRILSAYLIWQQDNRCGFLFNLSDEERTIVAKSIDYYLSIHNVMELVLSVSAKRSLKKALRKKIPDYMIPSVFVSLLQFPLTFSGKIDIKSLPPPQDFENILQKEYQPPSTPIEEKLVEIWGILLNRTNISMTDNFFDLGGSSITAAELSVKILNEYHISIPTKILFDLAYIPIIAEYIETKGKHYNTKTVIQEEIQRDYMLPDNIVPTKTLSKHIDHPQHILLTGGGGFLGIYLLRELLKQTDAKIYCLIRSGEFESAAKRLNSTIQKFNLSSSLSLTERRIVAIPSDISFDNFGMPLEQYNNLLSKIDSIFHCGAQVNMMAAYNKLRGSNVVGTLEIIKFATKIIDKPIHYISTLSAVNNIDAHGNMSENFPDEKYDTLFGGYAISKWVSERLLTQLKNRGLPVSIYRSGYIAGQSDNGVTSLNDALFMLIKGCIQLGYAPNLNERITVLSVDFVSKAITTIALDDPRRSGVYHIDHPTGIMWSDLVAWLNDYGYKIKIIPLAEWKKMLLNIHPDNALFPFLPLYLAKEEENPPEVSVEKATNILQKHNLAYPTIDDALLNIYFDYFCQINFLPQPNRNRKSIPSEK